MGFKFESFVRMGLVGCDVIEKKMYSIPRFELQVRVDFEISFDGRRVNEREKIILIHMDHQ